MFLTDDGLVVDPPPPAEDFMQLSTGGPMEGNPITGTARAIGGGVRDAAQGFIDLTGEIGEVMNKVIPAGYLTWGDDGFHYTTQKPEGVPPIELPQVPAGDSIGEGVARGITQFVAGLALTRGMGTNVGSMAVRSAVSDALFDPEHGTMANWLQDLGVENEVVEFFSTDVDADSDVYERLGGRLTQAFEGALIGVPIDGLMWGFQYAKSNPDLRNQIMESIGEFVADESGSVPPRRVGKTGQYVGAPKGIDTPQALGSMRRKITKLADEGVEGRFWYERSSQQLLNAVGGDVDEADKLIQAIAVTSPGTKVRGNFDYALQAYSQWKAGEPIRTGRFPAAMSKKLKSIFEGKDWAGRKTDDFYNNLMIHIDPSRTGPVTGDIWMLRAFGFAKPNEMPSPKQYEFITRETQRVATELGWEPHQVQAAIWVTMKGRSENPGVKRITEKTSEEAGWLKYTTNASGKRERVISDPEKHIQNWMKHSLAHDLTGEDIARAKFDFADALQGNLGQVSWESIPGRTGNHMPEMFNAPYEQQVEYHVEVSKAFLDDAGDDLVAKRLGILSPGDFEAPGYYEGKVSPSTQTEIVAPRRYKGKAYGELEPSSIDLIEAYAAARGILMKQDSVDYHRPFYNAQVVDSNGIEIQIGRNLTEPETAALADTIAEIAGHTDYIPISTRSGTRFVNFGFIGVENQKFHAILKQALDGFEFADGATYTAKRFNTAEGYLENDWSISNNGEGYMGGRWARRPDLQRKVRDIVQEVQARIDDIDYDFSDRYGWTRNDELNTSYRVSDEPIGAQQQNINPQMVEGVVNGN